MPVPAHATGIHATGNAERRPTINDVAELAGLSHQTVSRYFSRPDGLKTKTRERVEAAVNTLGYRPNVLARSMRTRRTQRIVIVLPALSSYVPFGILRGASNAAEAAGYSVEVLVLEGRPGRASERILDLASGGQADGILALSAVVAEGEPAIVRRPGDAPIVVFGEYDREMHAVGASADGSLAGDIVRYLADRGHRKIAHIAGPEDWPSARNRRAHFERAVEELGLPKPVIVSSDWSIRGGYNAAAHLLEPLKATAILAANDRIALGAMRRLAEHGLWVPRDVSIVGWDDDPMAEFLDPALTTVRIDVEQQGRQAVLALLHAIDGTIDDESTPVRADVLVERASVAVARHQAVAPTALTNPR
jgi:LacI family repressor for deo operon, udp, cdd, tsx, nupC, and nupG